MAKKNPSQRQLDIVVSLEEMARYESTAFESLRKELELPGFRKGHVPDDVARQHLPRERVFQEAVERVVAEKGGAALKKLTQEVVGEPKVEIRKAVLDNPLEFRVVVEVLPEVSLERWREMRVPFEPKKVGDEEVERALQELRRSRAKYRAVLRPAKKGDVAEVDFVTRVDGVKVDGGESKNHPVVLGEGGFVPGFEDAIVGMSVGEEKTIRLPFPSEWSQKHLAGREGQFTITVRNIQERLLPELDDAFAQSLGEFKDFDALKQNIREGLEEERKGEERRRVRQEAVKRLGERIVEKDIPEILITQEIERMRAEFRHSIETQGLVFEDYLSRLGKREEDFAQDWREGATDRVKAALVLRVMVREEKITVSKREVEERMQEYSRLHGGAGQAGEALDTAALRSYTENVVRNEKTLTLIEEVVIEKTTSEKDE